jgi:hypothetical protein
MGSLLWLSLLQRIMLLVNSALLVTKNHSPTCSTSSVPTVATVSSLHCWCVVLVHSVLVLACYRSHGNVHCDIIVCILAMRVAMFVLSCSAGLLVCPNWTIVASGSGISCCIVGIFEHCLRPGRKPVL